MGKKIEKIGRLEWLLFERAEPALVLAVLAVAVISMHFVYNTE